MPELLSETNARTLRVFLSYAAGEEAEAQEILDALPPRTRVFTVQNMRMSEKWRETIQEELQYCDLFLLLLTTHARERNWTLQELGAAMGLNKPILLIAAQPEAVKTFPYNLARFPIQSLQDFVASPDLNAALSHRAMPALAAAESGMEYEAAQQTL